MSINAVKGVEIGDGFAAAALSGEENADEMRMRDGMVAFLRSNHAGGILGGISTGQPIVARFAVKPTSSILTPRAFGGSRRQEIEITHQGPPRPLRRHPRRAGGRGDDGLRAGRPPAAPSAPQPALR
jgi:chorismate synthase